MKRLKKASLSALIPTFFVMLFFRVSQVFAQIVQPPTFLPAEEITITGRGDVCIGLANMIRTGNIQLRNIPCFIAFFTQTLVGISGTLAVIFVMVGGYRYVIGRDEEKDAAKKTITYALIGLAVSLLAWIIVNLVLQLITE